MQPLQLSWCPLAGADLAADDSDDRLEDFKGGLRNFSQFSTLREVSSLTYGDPGSKCNIVSSIEFDRDAEFFAVAGVTKKIKVTEISTVVAHAYLTVLKRLFSIWCSVTSVHSEVPNIVDCHANYPM